MLTNKDILRAAVRRGELRAWDPTEQHTRRRRVLFGVPAVIERLETPWGSGEDELEARRQVALAACASFVEQTTPLSLLFKSIGGRRGIAEMRILAPKPGIRFIGGFLDESVFVATALYLREEVAWKRQRTQIIRDAVEWPVVLGTADATWTGIFGAIRPIVPDQLRRKRG